LRIALSAVSAPARSPARSLAIASISVTSPPSGAAACSHTITASRARPDRTSALASTTRASGSVAD
jgi:hypothetical protein